MDWLPAHGLLGPGVAEELISRSMASSQVMGRAEPWTVQKLKRVGPMRGRSLRMMARCGMARAKVSRWAWSVQADRVQKVPFMGWGEQGVADQPVGALQLADHRQGEAQEPGDGAA